VSVGIRTALVPATWVLECRAESAPRHVGRVARAMHQAIDRLTRDGILPDELARAREPLVREAETQLASNAWWLDQLAAAQSKPQFLAGTTDRGRLYQATTAESLNALARSLFLKDRCCELRVIPK
jgi:zinc protease